MCRFVGYVSSRPKTLLDILGEEQCARFESMSALHRDGWGSAWLNASRTRRIRTVREAGLPSASATFARTIRSASSTARTLHIRMATDGFESSTVNTHPFLMDDIALSHNGAIVPMGPLRDLIPRSWGERAKGESDSELLLTLIAHEHASGSTLLEAVQRTARRVRRLYPTASLNCVALSSEYLVALRSSSTGRIPLEEFTARGFPPGALPPGHLDEYYQMSYVQTDETVVVSSSGLDTQGWKVIPPDTVLEIAVGDGSIKSHTLHS